MLSCLLAAPCSSIRDCLPNQVCVGNTCVPKCSQNNHCPQHYECRGGVCAPAEKCRSNDDCADSESCSVNELAFGQRECRKVCEGPVTSCGLNAVCKPSNHRALCSCPVGYLGDPTDSKVGCIKKMCSNNKDCPGDNICQEYRCVAPLEGK